MAGMARGNHSALNLQKCLLRIRCCYAAWIFRLLDEEAGKAVADCFIAHMLIKRVCRGECEKRVIGNYEKIDDMKLQETFVEQGKLLHRKHPVVDMHLDLAGEMLLRHQLGEQNVLYHRYLPAFWQTGIRLIASSVYVANCDLDHAWANALMQIELIKGEIVTCNAELADQCRGYVESAELANRCQSYGESAELANRCRSYVESADRCRGYEEHAGLANRCCGYVHFGKSGHADRSCRETGYTRVRLVKTWQDIEQVLQENELGILIYMEGLDCIGEDVDKLDELCAQGVRGAALTWSRPNTLANGCCKASEYRQITGGLTQTGKRAVKRLEALSMFLDVSHLNDDGFADVVRVAERPFAATHSNSRQVYDNYRNLTEDQLKKLGEQGGVAGLNGCQYIAGSKAGNHLDMLCRHVQHEVSLIGAEHVGFGFDLCDSYDEARAALDELKRQTKEVIIREQDDCLMSHAQIPLVTAALLQRGMKESDVVKVMGGSWLAYLKKVLV